MAFNISSDKFYALRKKDTTCSVAMKLQQQLTQQCQRSDSSKLIHHVFVLQQTRKFVGGGIMVWDSFTSEGIGPSILCNESATASYYKEEILQKHLLPFIQQLPHPNLAIYQKEMLLLILPNWSRNFLNIMKFRLV